MPAVIPVNDTERARMVQLYEAGESLHGIAKATGRGVSTVRRQLQQLGRDTAGNAEQTKAATEAQQLTNKAKRTATISRLYDQATKLLDRMDAAGYKVVGFDKDGYARVTEIAGDATPAADVKHLGNMVANYLLTAARLESVDTDNGADEARSMVGQLFEGLATVYGHLGGNTARDAVGAEL